MIVLTTYLKSLEITPDYAKYMLLNTPLTTVSQILVAVEKANIWFEGVFGEIVDKVTEWNFLWDNVKYIYDEVEDKVAYADIFLNHEKDIFVVRCHIDRKIFLLADYASNYRFEFSSLNDLKATLNDINMVNINMGDINNNDKRGTDSER